MHVVREHTCPTFSPRTAGGTSGACGRSPCPTTEASRTPQPQHEQPEPKPKPEPEPEPEFGS
jgi:hypothetical protein